MAIFPKRSSQLSLKATLSQMSQCWLFVIQNVLSPANFIATLNRGLTLLPLPRGVFQHFKGCYKGEAYDSALPPPRVFQNHPSCKPFVKFISATLLDRLATGAISLWGKVGEVQPPHPVMPLTVEPSKPRLCNDNRFLNLWIADRPFQLHSLRDVMRYTPLDSFQTICDDKSGYDHIFLSQPSRKYFGFQWGGWFFTSNSIPFGWKSSAYIYHTTGLMASHYFCSLGIPCSLYIDDRHTGQLHLPSQAASTAYNNFRSQRDKFFALANAAIFVVCYTLVSLGYFLGLQIPFLSHPCRSLTLVLRRTLIYRLSPFCRLKRTSFFLSLSPLCRPPNWSFFPSKSLLGNAFL